MADASFTIPIEHILQHNDISFPYHFTASKIKAKTRQNGIIKWLSYRCLAFSIKCNSKRVYVAPPPPGSNILISLHYFYFHDEL